MQRLYLITADNGDTYGIPAEIIADNYAKFYESSGEDYQVNFDAMIYWFDTKDYAFADWAKNNMDWDDVKDSAKLMKRGKVYMQDAWVNGSYQYICTEDINVL